MNLSKAMFKIAKLVVILEKVAAILDFQMFTYLGLTNASKYFLSHLSCCCCNNKSLQQITCENGIFDLENDIET